MGVEKEIEKRRKIENVADLPGVGEKTAEKLKDAGYTDLMAVAAASAGELADAAEIGEATAEKIIDAARKTLEMGYETASKIMERRELVKKITTGSKSLDSLLGGGVETQATTEFHGGFGSSKCVAKETPVVFLNDEKFHFMSIEECYNTYKEVNGETPMDGGTAVPVSQITVFGLGEKGIERVKASLIFKQSAEEICKINTKRKRELRLSLPHKLLTINENGMQWLPAGMLKSGDAIALPKKIDFGSENQISEDDAYFIGLFVAEGTANPLSISNSDQKVVDWIVEHVKRRFGYAPTVRTDKRNGNKTILLRKPTKEFLGELADCDAATKFIPDAIFMASENVAASYFKGYIEGDGCIRSGTVSMTTKSKKLIMQTSYLLKKLGLDITFSERMVNGEKYFAGTVAGFDRDKLNSVLETNFKTINSSYGYPAGAVAFMRKTFREALGRSKRSFRKRLGKRALKENRPYILLSRELKIGAINEKAFSDIVFIFKNGLEDLNKAKILNEKLEGLDKEKLREFIGMLPFSYRGFLERRLKIRKSTLGNYCIRGLPTKRNKELVNSMKKVFSEEIERRISILEHALKVCKNIYNLSWDAVTNAEKTEYNDYIYDFVVPEGHTFVGGMMPTLLHNTQVAHQLAVNVQLPAEQGGLEGNCLFIDTESTFRPERIKQMSEALGMDARQALENIFVARAYNSDHQMILAEKAAEMIREKNIKLLIVDSVTAHFRVDFTGRGELASRQQKLNRHLHTLQKLADVYNIAIYMTNQVMSRPDIMFGDPTAPIGGHVLAHFSTYRVYVRKSKGETRIARLIDSPHLPEGEAVFAIRTEGVRDIE